jgi:sorting nexin-1/2
MTSLTLIFKLAFASRIRTYHTWQNCDAEVRRAKQNHEKSRAQGRANSQSLSVIGEVSRNSATQRFPQQTLTSTQAERKALDAKQEFDQASRLVKTELARFEQERVEDFRDSLQAFLSGMIDRQKEVRKPLRVPPKFY